jgi:hypothetical protein
MCLQFWQPKYAQTVNSHIRPKLLKVISGAFRQSLVKDIVVLDEK